MITQLKKIRLELRMTQKQFAELLDVNVSTLGYYENGKRYPKEEHMWHLLKMCKKLDFPLTEKDFTRIRHYEQ